MANFHPVICTIASSEALETYASSKLPSTATPTEPVLKPRVCAPTTVASTPPARPSQIRPQ